MADSRSAQSGMYFPSRLIAAAGAYTGTGDANMKPLQSMNSCEVVTLGLLTALSLCESLSSSDLNILGNLISAVGSIVSTCAAQKQTAEEACGNTPSPQNMEARVRKLEKDLDALLGRTV